ncbi:MAG TPA: serine O-acetyltransferase [Thermoplasmata archaeon]|nr:serine O-acetyltransferase [Thermoplasmata archaeon]
MSRDAAWEADRRRYPEGAWFREPSIWAIAVYRFGRRMDRRSKPMRSLLRPMYTLLQGIVEIVTGISIPKSTSIGPGLRIHHFGGVVIHERAIIGANCTLRHGVTIGDRHHGGPVPVVEDDVELGAYAQILGGVRIGRGAKIGAMAVVLDDVPPGATAVGNPARVVKRTWTVHAVQRLFSAIGLAFSAFLPGLLPVLLE